MIIDSTANANSLSEQTKLDYAFSDLEDYFKYNADLIIDMRGDLKEIQNEVQCLNDSILNMQRLLDGM